MSTFNAGAIEASLTLDRSAFARDLRAAREQAKSFEGTNISPELTIRGLDKLERLRADIERISQAEIDVPFSVHGREQLTLLQQQLNRIDTKKIDVGFAVHGFDELVVLDGLLNEMDGRKIDIDLNLDKAFAQLVLLDDLINSLDKSVDISIEKAPYIEDVALVEALHLLIDSLDHSINLGVSSAASEGIVTATNRMQRWELILLLIIGLLPLLSAAVAVAGAEIVGLASALTAAVGAFGILALGAGGTLINMFQLNSEIQKQQLRLDSLTKGTDAYNKQAEKVKNLQHELYTKFGAASVAVAALKTAYGEFQDAVRPEATKLIADTLNIFTAILPTLVPLFKTFAHAAETSLAGIGKFMKGPEGKEMLSFFAKFGGPSLQALLGILGNLLKFFGRLFDAFAPFGQLVLSQLLAITASWAEWAGSISSNPAFQKFLDFVNTNAPEVWGLIVSIGAALLNIGKAAAPIAGPMLNAFRGLFDAIAALDPSALGTILVFLASLVIGFKLLTAVTAIYNAVAAASPWVIIAIAIIALVAAIIYLWKTNEGFRDVIIGIWQTILGAFQSAIGWITGTLIPAVKPVLDLFGALFGLVATVVVGSFKVIVALVGPLLSLLWTLIRAFITVMTPAWKLTWGLISTIVRVAWAEIAFVFRAGVALITGVLKIATAVVKAAFAFMALIVNTVVAVIKAAIHGNFSAIPGIISSALNQAKGIVSGAWTTIKRAFSDALKSIIDAMKSFGGSIYHTFLDAFDGAGQWLIDAGEKILGGLLQGLQNKYDDVKNLLNKVTGAIPDWKGPPAKDAMLLRPAGQLVLGGFISGLQDQEDDLYRKLDAITQRVATTALTVGTPTVGNVKIANQRQAQTDTFDKVAAALTIRNEKDRNSGAPQRVVVQIGEKEFEGYLTGKIDAHNDGEADLIDVGRKG